MMSLQQQAALLQLFIVTQADGCRCSLYTVCLSATSICGTAASSIAAADTTPPVITVLLNSLSVNATTTSGQLLVVTTAYVGEHARKANVSWALISHSLLYSLISSCLPRTACLQACTADAYTASV